MLAKHILYILPDGASIRNYLLTDILLNFENQIKITVLAHQNPEILSKLIPNSLDKNVIFQKLNLAKEPVLTRFLRESATYARLKRNAKITNNNTILFNWRKPNKQNKLYWLLTLSQVLGLVLKTSEKLILKAEQWSMLLWSKQCIKTHEDFLLNNHINSVFIAHQRIPELMPFCIAANNLNIKVTTAIFSWDNLPKARLNVKADQYLMWSEYMAEEFNLFYPHIPKEQLLVTGTPQFEHYTKSQNKIEREAFALNYNLPVDKKWICFSGDDITTSPNDQLYLRDLLQIIEAEFSQTIHVIFRRSPADNSVRYDDVLKRYQSVSTEIKPAWSLESKFWNHNYPYPEDLIIQYNLAVHCEAVINLGSTMAHDFATFNKPCFYLRYNQSVKTAIEIKKIYNFQHFKSMNGLKAVEWIDCKEDFVQLLARSLNDNKMLAVDKQNWLKVIARFPLEESSKLIAKAIE